MSRPSLSLAIVGTGFPNKRGPTRRFELEICRPGEPVHLIPEPQNPADEHAIAVFSCRGVQLGYLRSERAVFIGTIMNRGEEVVAIFQELTTHGAAIRVSFDGELPVLPPPKTDESRPPEGEAEPDWYPDEEWPD